MMMDVRLASSKLNAAFKSTGDVFKEIEGKVDTDCKCFVAGFGNQ